MSFFDISNLANKFAGFDIPPDTEFQQRSDDYGYTHTSEFDGGYDGQPPSGYPCGPQDGEDEYRRTHPDYSTSDTTRNGLGEGGTYSYNPSTQEVDEKMQAAQEQTGGSAVAELPEGWSKKFDDRYNRWFYVNKDTGETQWHPPSRDPGDETPPSGDDASLPKPSSTSDDPNNPWYHHGTHAQGGEASGYYAGNQYQANTPYQTGAFSESRGFPQDGNSGDGSRSYGGSEAPAQGGKSSSGYGKAMLGVAGGLAVGAAGGALLAHALASDSDGEDGGAIAAEDEPTSRAASAHYDEPETADESGAADEPESSIADSSESEPEPEPEPEPEEYSEPEEEELASESGVSEEEEGTEPEPEPEEEEAEAEASDSSSASRSDSEDEPEEEEEAAEEPEESYDDGRDDDGGYDEGGDDYEDDC